MNIENIRKIILSDENMSIKFNSVMEKDSLLWKKFQGPEIIFRWLNNFMTKREIYLALILADNIIYYNVDEIRYLWKLIFSNRLKRYLIESEFINSSNKSPEEINELFINFIKKKCVFSGYGDIYKSGSHMIYLFQQAVSNFILKKEMRFIAFSDFLSKDLKIKEKKLVIFLDDFIGSGNQAVRLWRGQIARSENYKKNKYMKFLYLALTGFLKGVKNIEQNSEMKVILGTPPMDESFRCFSEKSLIYEDSQERDEAEKVMENAGKLLYEYPLGYENDQAVIAFYYNTPNNSLPVIWKKMKDGSWEPLFERFE